MKKTKQWVVVAGMVLVLLAGLLFRLGYQVQTAVYDPVRADAGQYVFIAWNLIHHGVVSMDAPAATPPTPDSYRGPGYPLLIALTMKVGGEAGGWYAWLLFLQAVLGGLTALLVTAAARYWLPLGYALAAGLLVAVWPHMVTMSGYILTETLFAFLMVLGLYLLCRTWKTPSLAWAVLAGLVFGCAALVNPVIIPFPLLAAACLAFGQRRQAAVFLLAALLLPGIWSVRSAQLETQATLSSSGRLMENILIGMEPDFDSLYWGAPQGLAARQRIDAQLLQYQQDKEAVWQGMAGRLASEPGRYLQWYVLEKPLLFWAWSIGQGAGDIYVYPVQTSAFESNAFYRGVAAMSNGVNPLLMLSAFAMTAVLLLQAWRGQLRATSALIPAALLFFYATAVHAVLAPDVRYATPFRPFEILMAVSLVWYLQVLVQARRQAQSAAAGIKPSAAAE